jgi:GNAT superfamily N-acetyltransferase
MPVHVAGAFLEEPVGTMRTTLEVTDTPDAADRDAVIKGLIAYNEAKAGPTDWAPFHIRLRDGTGAAVGGLAGRFAYQWLFVELLFVPEALRGQGVGADIMRKAEAAAIERGCIGIWLDTFEFQARPFYEKLGFSVFGTIEDYPPGSRRYFLQKRLN